MLNPLVAGSEASLTFTNGRVLAHNALGQNLLLL